MRLTGRKSEKNRSLKQSVMPQKHVGNDLNRHTGKHAENTNTYDLFNLYFQLYYLNAVLKRIKNYFDRLSQMHESCETKWHIKGTSKHEYSLKNGQRMYLFPTEFSHFQLFFIHFALLSFQLFLFLGLSGRQTQMFRLLL